MASESSHTAPLRAAHLVHCLCLKLIHAATLGSDITQPTALVSHDSPDLKDDYDKHEDVLRQFDMNMAYGPCLGMSRLARWERAQRLGLNPPKEIEGLLKGEKIRSECLWDGCI